MIKIPAASCAPAVRRDGTRLSCNLEGGAISGKTTVVMSFTNAQPINLPFRLLTVALNQRLLRRVQLCLDVLVDLLEADSEQSLKRCLRLLRDKLSNPPKH